MELWPSLAAIIFFALAFIILIWDCAIDLKLRLLPDELTLALIVLGLAFHWVAHPYAGSWPSVLMGAIAGGGSLALVRAVANKIYGFETMGLGDVKLLLAFGIWLGPEGVLYALMGGAFAGVLHGVISMAYDRVKHGTGASFRELSVPAGPGFCIGGAGAAIYQFQHLPFFGGS